MSTAAAPLDIARAAALVARLDLHEGEPCRVAGCVHAAGAGEEALAA